MVTRSRGGKSLAYVFSGKNNSIRNINNYFSIKQEDAKTG
jgi:hypothetical protein